MAKSSFEYEKNKIVYNILDALIYNKTRFGLSRRVMPSSMAA